MNPPAIMVDCDDLEKLLELGLAHTGEIGDMMNAKFLHDTYKPLIDRARRANERPR